MRAVGLELVRPCEAQLGDVGGVDLVERRETLFGIGAAVGQPLAILLGGLDPLSVDLGGVGAALAGAKGEQGGHCRNKSGPHHSRFPKVSCV
jgi:hypothetical protein